MEGSYFLTNFQAKFVYIYRFSGTIGLPELALGLSRADMEMDDSQLREIVGIMVGVRKHVLLLSVL